MKVKIVVEVEVINPDPDDLDRSANDLKKAILKRIGKLDDPNTHKIGLSQMEVVRVVCHKFERIP